MIIYIVQGIFKIRGGYAEIFVGACKTEEEVFKLTNDADKRSSNETYKASQYDLDKNKYIGNSMQIFPRQKYNPSKDGHLDPPDNRDEDGFCKSRGGWGPYCHECNKMISNKLRIK